MLTLAYGKHEQYEGHQLFRLRGPATEIAALEGYLDILSAQPASGGESRLLEAIVRLSPTERQEWFEHFDQRGVTYTKLADNLAKILREHDEDVKISRINATRSGRSMTWDTYYNFDEINNYIDEIGAKYPEYVTVINAGRSYEGRQIKMARISTTNFEAPAKPVIIIDAAVHAREWVAPPVALYLIHQLVVEQADPRLLDELDWLIIPVANPDGYQYSIDEDRMWRKTRSKEHEGAEMCPGVDANRNFDHHWGTMPAASDPCATTFEGPTPFSEPETRIIRDVCLQNVGRAQLYLSLHSYGNMFLYAWGNNATLPPNGLALHLAGVTMATAIDELSIPGTRRYVVGNGAHILYFTTGTSRDWTRAIGIPLTYVVELPGYDYQFLVPPTYIEQIVTETWAGLAAGGHFIINSLLAK